MNEDISGATSGALNPDGDEALKHAEQYYESVRHMKTDCIKIAENTGMKEGDVKDIKNYIFMDKHDLTTGNRRFDPSFRIAQSWQRLIDGNEIKEQDIILLKHELTEIYLVKNGMTQDQAHINATKKYNYYEASERGI